MIIAYGSYLGIRIDIINNLLTDIVVSGEIFEDLGRVAHLLRLHLELAIVEDLVQLLHGLLLLLQLLDHLLLARLDLGLVAIWRLVVLLENFLETMVVIAACLLN